MSEVFVPRLPLGLYGCITSPAASDLLGPTKFSVQGWAVHAYRQLEEVRVSINSRVLAQTSGWIAPPRGVAVRVPSDILHGVGFWLCEIDLAHCPPGDLRIDAEARVEDEWLSLDRVRVQVGAEEDGLRPLGWITNLASGGRLERRKTKVAGFALHRDGSIKTLVISVDGAPVARFAAGLASAEAKRRYPDLGQSETAGWEVDIDLASVAAGDSEVTVEALMPNGSWALLDKVRVRVVD